MSSDKVQPRKVLVAGVSGRPWRAVLEGVSSCGHSISHERELPPLGSHAFRPQDYDLIAFGLPSSLDVHLPQIREMCTNGARPKLLLLGDPPQELALSRADPWGRLGYLPTSHSPEVLTKQILECLDNDWLLWGSPQATAALRAGRDRLPPRLRPLLSTGSALLRQVRPLAEEGRSTGALEEILSAILKVVDAESASFLAWDPQGECLNLQASVGERAARRPRTQQKLGEGVAGWVLEQDCPLLVWDLELVARFAHRPKRRDAGHSFVCLPVKEGGRLFGALTANARQGEVFTSAVLKAFSVFAEDLACALGIARELAAVSRTGGVRPAPASVAGTQEAAAAAVAPPPAVSWRELLASLPVGIVALDRELGVTFSNERAAALLGLEGQPLEASAIGKALGLSALRWKGELRRALEEGQAQECFQVPYAGAAGEKWFHLFLVPEREEQGTVVGVLLVIVEVKEGAALEQRLARMERQALLGEFAAKVAHNLNNNLDSTMRNVSLAVRRGEDAAHCREWLEQAQVGLERMANAVASLLAFSRGWGAVNQQANVREMIQEALQSFAERAKEQGVALEVDVSDCIHSVHPGDLFEVFANFIKNALEAMPTGGRLAVGAQSSGPEVTITFSDTGVGMSEEVKEKLFQPFFTTKKAGGGTGLGLAISQDIVRRCGGGIEVESEPGTGTTFTLRLPAGGEPSGRASG
jgi:signal transduction histidine kinase/putative methionine-R-sulfoxide reductase with GAF domain